jgi:hypothetical protein
MVFVCIDEIALTHIRRVLLRSHVKGSRILDWNGAQHPSQEEDMTRKTTIIEVSSFFARVIILLQVLHSQTA